jgi:hypothetical protein
MDNKYCKLRRMSLDYLLRSAYEQRVAVLTVSQPRTTFVLVSIGTMKQGVPVRQFQYERRARMADVA